MLGIQAKLRACYHLAAITRFLLDEALDLANDSDYDAHWIGAINRAIEDNLKVWHNTHNIAVCIDPCAPVATSDED